MSEETRAMKWVFPAHIRDANSGIAFIVDAESEYASDNSLHQVLKPWNDKSDPQILSCRGPWYRCATCNQRVLEYGVRIRDVNGAKLTDGRAAMDDYERPHCPDCHTQAIKDMRLKLWQASQAQVAAKAKHRHGVKA
jgi:hypothetical protein